jgi:hypothetical protein
MAQIPGQTEAFVDGARLPTPPWYTFLLELWNSLTRSWTVFTPVVTASGGTLGAGYTAQGRYRRVGKTVDVRYAITITNIGSGTGFPVVTLPPNTNTGPLNNVMLVGRETALTGKMLQTLASGSTAFLVLYYDNSSPLVNGVAFTLSGSFEVL